MVTSFFALAFSFFSAILIFKARHYGVSGLAFSSYLLKFFLCVAGLYVSLPFSGADAETFERIAWEWSVGGFWEALSSVDVTRSYLISSIIAIFYSIFGREVAIPIFINATLGMLIFYLSLSLAKELWGRVNYTFAAVVAFHPMLNINSAIVLRENYIGFFLVLAALFLVRFVKSGSIVSLSLFFSFVLFSSFFHGGMIVFAAGLPLYFVLVKGDMFWLKRYALGAGILVVMVAAFSFMEFGKLKDIQERGVSIEYLAELDAGRQEATTAYLTGIAPPSGVVDVVWQAPVRMFYLLAKPFPWDIRSFGHFLVFIDAFLWLALIYIGWRNRGAIMRNPAACALLLSCLVAILVFSYGTGNFGTGVRHRTKFIVLALATVSVFLPVFKFKENLRARR